MIEEQAIKLTKYSHGAGCGCKISPKVLDKILEGTSSKTFFKELMVGNEERDDAAVMAINKNQAIISTTDFFMPIVDDARTFGKIAAINAISDVFAMGGKPIMAIALLGWPINEIPVEYANRVIQGGREACDVANIPLAGGHSIDSPEPIFGLAVTGIVEQKHLKRNNGARAGDLIYLSKGLGVGILSTAQKKGLLQAAHDEMAVRSMMQLNSIGMTLGPCDYVHAMTDVTGFGLLGHLCEMCEASDVKANINFNKVPLLDKVVIEEYLKLGSVPGGTKRNLNSYGHKIGKVNEQQKQILADPQTSGGLLIAVDPAFQEKFESICKREDQAMWQIGAFAESISEEDEVLIKII